MTTQQKELYRSTADRKIAGVCGGIAEYFGMDPTFVRAIFIALAIAGGVGIVAYAVMWIMVPERPAADVPVDNELNAHLKATAV